MLRAWIPSLVIFPLAVAALSFGCSASAPTNGGLGPQDGTGASNSSGGSSNSSGGGSNHSGGSGGIQITMMEGGDVDPCAAAGLPEGCTTMLAPACGDGTVNQPTEECDDGNTLPGDCCSGACKVEPYCVCPPGEACHTTIVCGDGMRGPGEACDDGNTTSGDGCSSDCHTVELGYSCATPGQPCVHHYTCGDGVVDPNEGCDDGNITAGDGCSDHCRIEQGFKCDGAPSKCTPTTCGDGKKEGAESCDDGNTIAFDGCSPDCRAEPTCATGMPCTSSCGDGIVFGNEQCDDGNLRDGDGCSSTCMVEEGYVCNNDAPCTKRMGVDPATGMMAEICAIEVPATFRDFNANMVSGGHPDFQPGYDSPGGVQGLVQDTLDADGKPVLSTTASVSNGFMHGTADFAEWYRDGKPSSGPIPGSLVLWDNTKGGYVNRWGANGEQWQGQLTAQDYGTPRAGLPVTGMGCSDPAYPNQGCTPGAGEMCYDPCIPWGANQTQSCCAIIPASQGYDGNPLFFPIDTAKGILTEPRSEGKVPSEYGWNGWPWESDCAAAMTPPVTKAIPTATASFPSKMHNFSFTTEVKYWFKYNTTTNATLDFTGDDDVWVFLNGHLAVDLGGWHVPLNGTLTINAGNVNAVSQVTVNDDGTTKTQTMKKGTAASFGLTDGNVYQIQIFHAERQVEGSSFKLTLAGFNMTPSDCVTDCGDGMVGPGEECDDGHNTGAYNQCGPGCVLGPRCGDGVVQKEDGEVCDDGVNAGTYGGCGPDCQPGPHCGDGVVQKDQGEVCDDGMNVGNYGGCAPGCVLGPYCGDGSIAVSIDPSTGKPYEECDDGNMTSGDGCSNCKVDVVVPR
jgi:fibro-slime domain-containing protein